MAERLSPHQYARHADALRTFRTAYEAYLDRWEDPPLDPEKLRLRQEVMSAVPAAGKALDLAGYRPAIHMGLYAGHGKVSGLANVVFAHEEMSFQGSSSQTVLDSTVAAIAAMEDRRRDELRRRLNPLYWIDRVLRALLGIPAYLISLLFRVPLDRIEDSPFGTALRVVSLVVEVAVVVLGLHEWFGWF